MKTSISPRKITVSIPQHYGMFSDENDLAVQEMVQRLLLLAMEPQTTQEQFHQARTQQMQQLATDGRTEIYDTAVREALQTTFVNALHVEESAEGTGGIPAEFAYRDWAERRVGIPRFQLQDVCW